MVKETVILQNSSSVPVQQRERKLVKNNVGHITVGKKKQETEATNGKVGVSRSVDLQHSASKKGHGGWWESSKKCISGQKTPDYINLLLDGLGMHPGITGFFCTGIH